MNKLILVTGGGGYIGSHVADVLLNAGFRVRVMDNLTYGGEGVKPYLGKDRYEFLQGNICHIEDAVAAMKGVYAIIDLAAIVGDPACEKDHDRALAINYEATKVLVEMGKYFHVERFLFASTCSVYGFQDQKADEQSTTNPVSLYAESKLKSEEVLFENCGAISPTIFRLATVYGGSHRMRFDLVLNILTIRALMEKEISVYGGQQWRPLVHARDVAECFRLALEAPAKVCEKQIFNLGSNEQNFRVHQIAEAVVKRFPGTRIKQMPDTTDNRSYEVNFDKVKKVLGYKASKTLLDGMNEIETLWQNGKISNYKDAIYYNVHYLYR